MEATWAEKLTPEEEDRLIAKLTYEVKRRKLEVPVVFFLEMHKPLAGIAGNAAIATTPFFGSLVGLGNWQDYGRLFGSMKSVEKLIRSLEDPTEPTKPDEQKSLRNDSSEVTSNDDEESN